jgi:hypothetical protein
MSIEISGLAVGLVDSDSERAVKIHQSGGVIASIMNSGALSHGYQLA